MKKRKKITINIHLTNRWLYTLIAVGILAIIAVGVYALAPGVIPNPGHNISEISIPSGCVAGQFLKYDGTKWVCSGDYCAGGTCNGNLNVNNNITTFGVINLMTTLRYHYSGSAVGGFKTPRCPCDISTTASDCPEDVSYFYTRTDVGSVCYDQYTPQNQWSRRWDREYGGPWVMKTYS